MSRPLRIEYPGAWYHVMNRGRRFENVLADNNEPRNVSNYLIRPFRMETLRDIGKQFKIEKYSSVSSIIERVKVQMKVDSDLAKRIDMLSHRATKSQRQT